MKNLKKNRMISIHEQNNNVEIRRNKIMNEVKNKGTAVQWRGPAWLNIPSPTQEHNSEKNTCFNV